MDLVSSTLERYLKHRFNGSELHQIQPQSHHPPQQQEQHQQHEQTQTPQVEPLQKSSNLVNGITTETHFESKTLPRVYNLSIRNTQPCCTALREDLKFFAAGFENSHIHLWTLEYDNELNINSNSNCLGIRANNADNNINCDLDDVVPIDTNGGFMGSTTNNTDRDSQPKCNYSIGQHRTLLAHTGSIYRIKFVNNDDLMLSCSEDATIRLWCLKTACNLTIYRGHSYPIWSLDIGSQGLLFATCSMDNTARLWRLDRMTPLRIFCGHDADVEVVKFHPNEKYIATGSTDKTVRLWNVSDGLMVRLMIGHDERIVNLSFHPNGKFLASASCDGIIKLWDLATNLVTSQLTVVATHMISFSPNLYFVSSCGADNILKLSQVGEIISTSKIAKLVEKKHFNLDETSSVIECQFVHEDKLFVITHHKEEFKETNKIT